MKKRHWFFLMHLPHTVSPPLGTMGRHVEYNATEGNSEPVWDPATYVINDNVICLFCLLSICSSLITLVCVYTVAAHNHSLINYWHTTPQFKSFYLLMFCWNVEALCWYYGPYLAPSAIDFVHRRMCHSYFAPAQSALFPPQKHVAKLVNELALPGRFSAKKEACSGANNPWCYFAVPLNNCATDQKKPSLKSVARCALFIMLF